MNNPDQLDQLGQRMAGLQDRHLAELRQEANPTSPALGEHLLRRSIERRRNRRLAATSMAVLLLAGASATGLRLWPGHKQATIATVQAQAGQRVAASSLDMALAFDDGSQVVLSSGASLRTEAVGPSSATLELERGRATVRVVHTRATRWTVRAGSYSIAVTGTRFQVNWRPEGGAFSLAVEEGSVRVSGGLLGEPLDIRAGQSITLEQGNGPASRAGASPTVGEPPAKAPPEAPPAPSVEEQMATPEVEPAVQPLQPRRQPARHLAPSSWRSQAEAGRYRDALDEAERRGFDGICRDASGSDLLTLAEAARFARRPERAEQALKAIRARFGRGEDAAMAAYLLGRIAAENRHDHAAAARWFRAYLAERPGGRLDREAEGRLLESLAFMDRTTARDAARAYLQHHPSGPHAGFARNLLGQ